MPYRLGVDVGGTFTDLILVDEKSGSIHTAKVPSTPADSSIGVMNGVAKICDNASGCIRIWTELKAHFSWSISFN